MLSREEYVLNMVLRSSSAVTTDVPTLSRMEEYAGATEGRIVLRNVAMKNAPTLLFKEECVEVEGMVQRKFVKLYLSHEGCTNRAVKGGVCTRPNKVQIGGLAGVRGESKIIESIVGK